MSPKSEHLQIRISAEEKAEIKHLARVAGQDISSYVRGRVLPAHARRFRNIVERLRADPDHRFALAAAHDLLAELSPAQFGSAVGEGDMSGLSPFLQNYVAAMVEHAALLKGLTPPPWTAGVRPLERPWFAVPFASLRGHLLKESPVAFKRRNLFVDSSVGDRV